MKFRTKTRYGMRAIVEIAKADRKKGILQKDISKNQGISIKYLDQIVHALKEAGLIENVKGKKSGYRITRNASDITVHQIHLAFEPEIAVIDCLSKDVECRLEDVCHTISFWTGLNQVIINYFNEVTLQDLMEGRNLHSQ
ncbi:Rrf2 family transcriptional regulator [Prolixibacteraceae bacterium Z1-6]|uniref:Rrf2 family transcriptional regulator n=1 Tax=Draconibacterium aestuarii TaxID=2998507 RepID=A0A9X3F838_9BACT|nr:Rrf2 family transcriptional regulator [Prolixibacteraceae bacterium Z1-6]